MNPFSKSCSDKTLYMRNCHSEPSIPVQRKKSYTETQKYKELFLKRRASKSVRQRFSRRFRQFLYRRTVGAVRCMYWLCCKFISNFKYTFCILITRREKRKDVLRSVRI
ncbi:hypothetical protein PAEPH01_1090 [Pancytospora epiphaga]|nr:hypothetical protein PAEPH01_1090 [Pancytospora epiphaga]